MRLHRKNPLVDAALSTVMLAALLIGTLFAQLGCATDDLQGLTTRDTSVPDSSAEMPPVATSDDKSPADAAVPDRSLASTDGKLEQSFTKVMNSPQASDYLNQELSRVQVLHDLSVGYLKAFDELLAATVAKTPRSGDAKFLENAPYAQLMATKRLIDETESRLDYFLYRALETKWSEDVRPEHKQAAVQLVEHFKFNLERRADDFATPALQELARGFARSAASARADYLEQYKGTPPPGLAHELTPVLEAIGAQVFGQKKPTAKAPSAETVSQVAKDVAVMVNEIKESWKTDASTDTAANDDVKIEPSTGAAGAIDGSRFKDGTWALTFDDGPSPHTDSILQTLDAHQARASFFWVAENVLQQKDRVKAAEAAGMNLGNHTFTNFDLGRKDATFERIQHEIVDSTSVETKAFGYRPKIFRCPYGSCLHVESVRETLEAQKFVHVQWNIDSLDWIDHSADSIYKRVEKQMALQKHGIILMHDTQAYTPQAIDHILREAGQDHSGKFVTIQDMIDETNSK